MVKQVMRVSFLILIMSKDFTIRVSLLYRQNQRVLSVGSVAEGRIVVFVLSL